MKNILWIAFFYLVASPIGYSSELSQCKNLKSLRLKTEQKETSIEQRMQELNVPGVSIALIENFKLKCVKNFGVKDKLSRMPVDDLTLFQAASITKPVTSVATLQLVASRALDLNSPVNNLLSGWKIPPSEYTKKSPVRLFNLLNHTGGLTVHGFPGYKLEQQLPDIVQILNGTPPANSGKVYVSDVVGQNFKYSGGGYTILQLLLTEKTKKPFKVFIKDKIFSPLAMSSSFIGQPLSESRKRNIAKGFSDKLPNMAGGYHVYPELAAAGMWTTSSDLAKFVIDLQRSLKDNTGKLLSKKMVKTMMTTSKKSSSGFGIMIDDMYFSHGGWNEGYSSRILSHLSAGYGVVILTNANKPQFIAEFLRSYGSANNWEDF